MLKPNSETLHVGDMAPEFTLSTVERKPVQLANYRDKPLALVFIRGTW